MTFDNWGHRARFGIFIVGAEAVPEAEWWAMAPSGVSIHAARVTAKAPWATWDQDRDSVTLAPDLAHGADQFGAMAVSAAVVAHSSSSVVGGPGWDKAVTTALKQHLHPQTQITTNGIDCVLALRHLDVQRPFLVFPPWFTGAPIQSAIAYAQHHELQPAGHHRNQPDAKWAQTAAADLYANYMHMNQNVEALRDQIIRTCPGDADSVLIVGTGLRCVGIIGDLESALGRPVVTANQASLWRCLSLTNVQTPIQGYGRLLSGR